ncbi:MAG: phage scaffolding protein [Lachnospiraceae bacterium]|jgi:polyhydroxyalkanoate synthesis regulator phasin
MMKNIFEIMKEFGIEVPEDRQKDFEKKVLENYKTASDYDVQAKKLEAAEGKVQTLTDSLGKFKDVDVDRLNGDIEKLRKKLEDKDRELADQLAERDFMDVVRESIHAAKGKDTEKIIRLLDIETLKASKNQKDDIAAAVRAMAEDDVTKGMFQTGEPEKRGTADVIGGISGGSGENMDAQMRAVMGLPPAEMKGE